MANYTNPVVNYTTSEGNGVNAYHIASNPAIYQPARRNNFRFVLQLGSNTTVATALAAEFGDLNAVDVIDFSCIEFEAPHYKQDEIDIKRGNKTIYYAGLPTWDESPLKIVDYIGANGKSILMALQRLSYNIDTDAIQSSDKYKFEATVLEYTPDNQLVRYWDIKGAWVKGLDEDSYSAESGDKKTVTATIRYDWAVPHYVSNRATTIS